MTGNAKRYLVSAIVSTYKAERLLRGKLEDLEAQTIAGRLEIVVIDSGSPENERAIVEEFQKRYDNIRYLRTEKRETVYQAWNRGIKMATGEFVANANTDDRLRKDAYEVLVRTLREHPECVLAYPDFRITQVDNGTFENHVAYGFKSWPPYDRTSLLELCCVGPFPLWRRSLHDEIGYFDERYRAIGDYEFWLRASERCQFVHVPQFLGLYWLNEQTVSRNGDLPTLEYLQIQKVYRKKFAHLIVKPPPHPVAVEEAFAELARPERGSPSVAELERFTKAHPDFAAAHHQLAQLYFKDGDIGRARKHFEKAVLLDPDSREFTESLEAFLRLELYQSLQLHKGLVLADPAELETQLATGMILILLERYQAAREHYLRALEIDPDCAVARENLARLEPQAASVPPEPPPYYAFRRPEVQALLSRRSRRVLDVGCAAGEVGRGIKMRQGAEVWGIEPAAEAAQAARCVLDRVIEAPVEKALSQLPAHGFDSIVLADVLEHLVDPAGVLCELSGRLAPGGELIVSLPNVGHWSVVQGLLNGEWEYADAGILDRTHLRFFTRKSALDLFRRSGYAVTDVKPIHLAGDDGIPPRLMEALAAAGAKGSFERESAAYQYLFRLVPEGEELTSIVILTWNELDCTRECLESIVRHTPEPHEVILVDNGSTDGTLPFLREFCAGKSGYRLIENGENLGFAAGCNVGMREARGGRILLLNNDTVVTRGWLSGMIEALERDPKGGIVGPMTNEIAGLQKVPFVPYRDPAGLDAFAGSFRKARYGQRIETDRLTGFCMLFSRSLLNEIGELDTRFGSGNFEDDDFCLRAALAGYRCVIAGDVFIHHYGSRTFTGNRIDHAAAMRRNRKAFDAKWELGTLEKETACRVISHNARLKGRRLAREGRLSEAVETLLQEGIRPLPASPAPYLDLAGILAEAGNYRDALDVLAQLPAGAELQEALLAARCHIGLAEGTGSAGACPPPAAEAIDRALALDPDSPAALLLQGELLYRAGDPAKSEEILLKSLSLDPGLGLAASLLAAIRWERGEQKEAFELAERGFVLAPVELATLARYHDYATDLAELSREEERLKEAIRLYPEHKGLFFGLIELLIRNGRYDEAVAAIGRAAARFGLDQGALDAGLEVRRLAGEPPAPKGKGTVSLCMIVKDEARHLASCLDSVAGLADEIVVVDTGSSDETCDIARLFGARLFSFPWTGDFSEARNYSLSKAQGEWILVLDADEVLAPADVPPLAELVKGTGRPTAFSFTTRNYTTEITRRNWSANEGEYPGQERGRGFTPSEKVRLFPNDARFRFEGAVHELLEPSLVGCGIPIHACDVPVHHYGRLDGEKCRQKQEQYYLLGLKKLRESGASHDAILELARQATELSRREEAVELWQQVLAAHPKNAEAYLNLGYLDLAAAKYREAHAHALEGARLAPGMKEAAFNLAKCEFFLGNVEKALSLARGMLEKWPDYPPALSLLSVCLLLDGKIAESDLVVKRLAGMRFDCADFLNEYAGGLEKGERGDLAAPIHELAKRLAEPGGA